MGRPPERFPREHQIAIRLSDAELGALKRALAVEHSGTNKPTLAAWVRELAIAGAGHVLGCVVRRDRIDRDGPTTFEEWRAARRAAKAAKTRRRRKLS